MADTKDSRESQARDEQRRQRRREVTEAVDRADEAEPPPEELDEEADADRGCHRRGCDEPAAFLVLERYQEDTGHGAVEATAVLCRDHAAEERPANLDGVYPDYVFRVEPLPGALDADAA